MLNLLIGITLVFSVNQTNPVKEELKSKMEASALCWNNGDLECFMQTYWKSDSLKFISGTRVTYGWENTLQMYKVGYPTQKERGKLSFNFIAIERISNDAYFMVGKFALTLESDDITGHFSLLWKNIEGNWVIVADHSSN